MSMLLYRRGVAESAKPMTRLIRVRVRVRVRVKVRVRVRVRVRNQ